MKRKKRTRKKRRIGVSLASLLFALLLPAAARQTGSYAVVAGTVFRDPGFAFPRVEVTISAEKPPPGVKMFKPAKTVTDGRGEFSFRLPDGAGVYKVRAGAPGFAPAEKQVAVNAGERADVYLELKPVPK
jgi:hypothetical protein